MIVLYFKVEICTLSRRHCWQPQSISKREKERKNDAILWQWRVLNIPYMDAEHLIILFSVFFSISFHFSVKRNHYRSHTLKTNGYFGRRWWWCRRAGAADGKLMMGQWEYHGDVYLHVHIGKMIYWVQHDHINMDNMHRTLLPGRILPLRCHFNYCKCQHLHMSTAQKRKPPAGQHYSHIDTGDKLKIHLEIVARLLSIAKSNLKNSYSQRPLANAS